MLNFLIAALSIIALCGYGVIAVLRASGSTQGLRRSGRRASEKIPGINQEVLLTGNKPNRKEARAHIEELARVTSTSNDVEINNPSVAEFLRSNAREIAEQSWKHGDLSKPEAGLWWSEIESLTRPMLFRKESRQAAQKPKKNDSGDMPCRTPVTTAARPALTQPLTRAAS